MKYWRTCVMRAQANGGCLARRLLRIQHSLRPLWGVSGSHQSRRLPSLLVRASLRSFVADGDEAILLDRFWQVQAQSLTMLRSSESCLLTKQQLRRLQARGVHDVEQRRRLIDAVAQSAEKGGASVRTALAPLLLCAPPEERAATGRPRRDVTTLELPGANTAWLLDGELDTQLQVLVEHLQPCP